VRIAICDGNIDDRRRLSAILQEQCVDCRTEQYADGDELTAEIKDCTAYDIVFLSVNETTSSGFDIARQLRSMGYGGDIVLSANSAAFAVDGYDVGANGFLLKPFSPERLIRLINRLKKRTQLSGCLMISHYGALVKIVYDDILYIESSNSKCIVHLNDERQYVVYRRLSELEAELDDPRFLRCHQSYLVNMDHIIKADRSFELANGEAVCIRQRDVKSIREHYLAYINDRRSAIR